ncbi:MAG: OmpH family outer membrane protein [Bacteroidales bacterium]|nr:OmpH family outer membrane protein [Bacteroidales bacterium]
MKKCIIKALFFSTALAAFASCNQNGKPVNVSSSNGASVSNEIAFVYIDSLVNGYDLYNDEATKLMTKTNQYEQELQSKGKSIERRFMELQSNFEKKLVTPTRAQEIQQNLQLEQQKLLELREKQAMELSDDQAQIMNRVGDSIKNYIKEYNKTKGFKMIMSTQGSSTLLYADPNMDVTQEILKALNERYRKGAADSTAK